MPTPRAHFFWRIVFPVVVVLSGAAVALSALEGARTIIGGTIGRVEDSVVVDPSQPGYLAFVSPTPALLLVHEHGGSLAGVTLLAQARSDTAGAVLLFTPSLLFGQAVGGSPGGVPGDGGDGVGGDAPASGGTLVGAYAVGGASAVEHLMEGLLGLGFTEVREMPQADLAAAVQSVEPMLYRLSDDLVGTAADGSVNVVYPSGSNEFSSWEVADIYGFRSPGEADSSRVERQRRVWEAWLGEVALSVSRQRGGESEEPAGSDLAQFLRTFVSAGYGVETVPVRPLAAPPGGVPGGLGAAHSGQLYALDAGGGAYRGEGDPGSGGEIAGVGKPDSGSGGGGVSGDGVAWLRGRVRELVPWPSVPESFKRPTVQMLDGVGRPEARDALARDVIAAGGIVTVIGNESAFGRMETLVAYHHPEVEAAAEDIAIALRPEGYSGAGMAFVEVPEDEEYIADITVRIGRDLVPS